MVLKRALVIESELHSHFPAIPVRPPTPFSDAAGFTPVKRYPLVLLVLGGPMCTNAGPIPSPRC